MKLSEIVATAHPNIALVKYWGKRDKALNLPAVGSLSITLDTLTTRTCISTHAAQTGDRCVLNNAPAATPLLTKIQEIANHMWRGSAPRPFFAVRSDNNFPTAAGLASSASGFAAMVVGMNAALGSNLAPGELAVLARLGSGSAPRSLLGGFAIMDRGSRQDGRDAIARPLLSPEEWPLEVVVAITSHGKKMTSSTEGMERTRESSPYYAAWVEQQEVDLREAEAAVNAQDFAKLADVAEYSCLKMHGLMMSARPGLLYWNAATLQCIHKIRALRSAGTAVFFTVDAGPQVKAICAPGHGSEVATRLAELDGVEQVQITGLGAGARVVNPA